MLFDLRSRGRRRTVQGVYLALAILMGGGLVLFGVGTGSGIGGLLNAFTNNSSSNNKPVISQAEKTALRQTQLEPNNPSAWKNLVQARYEAAGQNQNQSTGAYTAAGVSDLKGAAQAWQRYLQLTKTPDWTVAVLVAQIYRQLNEPKDEIAAWELVTEANPNVATYYEDLASSAWAAKDTDLGDLAAAKAISLTPKDQQAETKATLQQLKTQATSGGAASSVTPSGAG